MLYTATNPPAHLRHEEFVRRLREERAISLAEASAANDPAQPSLPSRDFLRPTVSVPRPASIVSSQLATTLLERAEAEERGAEPEPEEPAMDRFRRELATGDEPPSLTDGHRRRARRRQGEDEPVHLRRRGERMSGLAVRGLEERERQKQAERVLPPAHTQASVTPTGERRPPVLSAADRRAASTPAPCPCCRGP